MPRVTPILTTFNGGEWSPQLYGRVDLDKYGNACRQLDNFIPTAQGVATRRPGTRHVASARNDGVARLIPFEFSTTQAYIIEATDQRFRFFMNRGRIESPPGTPIEVTMPYTAAQLAQIKWTQSADTLYLVHPLHQPRKLTRSSHTSWTLSALDALDGPYLDLNTGTTTLTPSATTGSITLTASAALFQAGDVGRRVRLRHGATWGWVEITAFTSATLVTASVRGTLGGTAATTQWRLGAWGTVPGWPGCVTFHEERLTFANTPAQPQTIWGSMSGDYENFAPSQADGTVGDDNALTFTISDDRVNAIHWMSAGRVLAIGTAGGEFTMQASSLNEVVTPSSVVVRRETTRGVADMMPVRIGPAMLFVQRARRKLYEMAYSYEADAQLAPEMTLLAGHLTRERVREIAWQPEPWNILWACLDDGSLVGLTYMRDQQVVAWHRQSIAGGPSAGSRVVALAVVPGDGQDELWMVVERTVDGVLRRHIEYLSYEFWPTTPDDKEFAVFADASLQLDNTVATPLTPSAASGTGVTFTAGAGVFAPSDIGREIRRRWRGADGAIRTARALITAYTSATVVQGNVLVAFPSAAAIPANEWRLTVTTIGGLGHLEGRTVQILADGAAHPDRVVSGGQVALDRPAAIAQVGLGYVSQLETMDLEHGAMDGTAQGRRRRIHQVGIKLWSTLGARVGVSGGPMDAIEFRAGATRMDESPPLFTGDRIVVFPAGWSEQARVLVVQDQPLPCTIAALVPRMTTNE